MRRTAPYGSWVGVAVVAQPTWVSAEDEADQLMDMLLAKKRAGDRRAWLEHKGNLAQV